MTEQEKNELAKAIVELIYTNGEVRSTIMTEI